MTEGPNALIRDCMLGLKPTHYRMVRFADLAVEQPHILARARQVARENPSMVEMFRDSRGKGSAWIVFRDDDDILTVCDDYNGYASAELDKVEMVRVQVLGEAAPDIEGAAS
jgi:hypothetical protein